MTSFIMIPTMPRPTPTPTIGVFDSGFGGLTVLKELVALIPGADYLYFGDTARLPYGSKSADTVAKYAVEAAHFLETQGANFLVIACNTATALALDQITRAVKVPVIGVVEPGAEQASSVSKTRRVVVIGTEATVSSHAYLKALERHGIGAREKACPLLVPLVEEGWTEHPVTEQVAQIYLNDAFAGGFQEADVLVLGCTHYPLIKPLLRRIAPARVQVIDSAHSTANAVAQKLRELHVLPLPEGQSPHLKFFATDSVEKFRRMGPSFLGHPVKTVEHVDLKE